MDLGTPSKCIPEMPALETDPDGSELNPDGWVDGNIAWVLLHATHLLVVTYTLSFCLVRVSVFTDDAQMYMCEGALEHKEKHDTRTLPNFS